MKKILALILALTMVFTLAACGSGSSAGGGESSAPAQAASEAKSEAAPAAEASSAAAETASASEEIVPSDDPVVSLSMASYIAAGNPHENMIQYACNEAYKRSGGTIKIEYYPGGTLCGQQDMLDGLLNGVTDIGFLAAADTASAMPELSMIDHPGIYFTASPSIGNAVKEYIETYQPAEVEGLHFLCAAYGTKGCICSNKGPIHTPADLAGQTIRATGANATAVTNLGAVPSDIAFADCYESLRQGVIDGIMTIRGGMLTSRLYEVLDYGMDYPFYNNGSIWFMNEDSWNKLTPNQQEALQSAFDDAFEMGWSKFSDDLYKQDTAVHFQDMKEYYYPTEDELKLFQEAVSVSAKDYADTLDNGAEIMQRWEDLAEKWNAQYPPKKETDDDFYFCIDPNTGERLQTGENVDFTFTLIYQ